MENSIFNTFFRIQFTLNLRIRYCMSFVPSFSPSHYNAHTRSYVNYHLYYMFDTHSTHTHLMCTSRFTIFPIFHEIMCWISSAHAVNIIILRELDSLLFRRFENSKNWYEDELYPPFSPIFLPCGLSKRIRVVREKLQWKSLNSE